ncbi:MAG: DUF1307 domain-containing protein [Lachnospiraceae bacterium]|nr:DUF1307 domain-containing protein [Lachnospiraceae bacterium]
MKKLVKLLLCMTLVLALAGCGKEQKATYKMEQDMMGMTITDTQIITAKGDKVVRMEEITEISFADFTDEEKELAAATYDETYGAMKDGAPDSVKMEYGLDGDVYRFTLDIDIANGDIKELIDGGFVYATSGDAEKAIFISFKQTCEGLEKAGYTAQ